MKTDSKLPDTDSKVVNQTETKKSYVLNSAKILNLISNLFGKYQNQVLLALVFFLALFLRLWQIAQIPPGVSTAENLVISQIKNSIIVSSTALYSLSTTASGYFSSIKTFNSFLIFSYSSHSEFIVFVSPYISQ